MFLDPKFKILEIVPDLNLPNAFARGVSLLNDQHLRMTRQMDSKMDPKTYDYRTLEGVRQVGFNGLMFKRLGKLLRLIFVVPGGIGKSVTWFYIALIVASTGYQACAYYIGIYIPEFYTYLLGKDAVGFSNLVGRLVGLILAIATTKALISVFGGLFALRTRKLLVKYIQTLYVAPGSLYHTVNQDVERIDNPHQRITQDVDKFALSISYILTQIVISPALFIYYTYDLVKTAGWTAPVTLLCYFLVSCLVTRFVIPHIAKVVFVKEKKEGDFRYLHVKLADEAEAIAFLKGEFRERDLLETKLGEVLTFQRMLVYWNMLMAFIIGIVDYLGSVISYAIIAVPIFNGTIENPDATQIGQSLFVSFYLLNVFTTIVDLADKFADLAGYIARIGQFVFALEEYASNAPMQYHDSDEESDKDKLMVKVQDLTYAPSMESQTAIVQGLFFTAIQGQHVILSGRSGCGKSTALKVLAGLWEPLSGLAHVPRGQSTYFMPQSAYLIVGGTLKEQLTYPESPEAMTDAEMHSLLEESEISSLLSKAPLERDPSRAIQSEDWTASLSAGEKQRIAFARMLWRSPKFTFMDEGTVHLNAELESRLLAKAVKRGITFIAVSHSPLPCLSGALHVNVDEFACGL